MVGESRIHCELAVTLRALADSSYSVEQEMPGKLPEVKKMSTQNAK